MSRLPTLEQMRSSDAEAEQQPESLSLMSGVAGDDADGEMLGLNSQPSAASRLWNSGVLLILLVAGIAAGALYLMHISGGNLGSDAASSQVESKIELYLAKLTNPQAMAQDDPLQREQLEALFRDTDQVIALFDNDLTEKQVPVEYVKKNPFALRISRQVTEADPNVARTEQEKLARRRALETEYKRLNLQSVSDMRVMVAMINGEMYRVGERVGSFRIDAISSKHQAVKLVAGDEVFVLRMQEQLPQGRP